MIHYPHQPQILVVVDLVVVALNKREGTIFISKSLLMFSLRCLINSSLALRLWSDCLLVSSPSLLMDSLRFLWLVLLTSLNLSWRLRRWSWLSSLALYFSSASSFFLFLVSIRYCRCICCFWMSLTVLKLFLVRWQTSLNNIECYWSTLLLYLLNS